MPLLPTTAASRSATLQAAASHRRRLLLAACALLLAAGFALPRAQAASSVMLWPVDPVIEDGQRAAAIWLENKGSEEASLQIRVFGWSQTGTEEVYEAQERVIASPPLAVIPPGQRQLVRLMSTQPVPEGREVSYRVLVDELPSSSGKDNSDGSMGVKLQIRYSLPLFVYGKGLSVRQRNAQRDLMALAAPKLDWRVEREGATQYLRIRNSGKAHARLTNVEWVRDGNKVDLHKGLLGYVLAGSEMRWPLNAPPPEGHAPQATVNASETPVLLAKP